EFRTGVYLQPLLRSEDRTVYSNNGFAQEEVVLRDPNNVAAGYIPFHRTIYDVGAITTNKLGARDYAAYAQDSWRPTSRLTINGGARFDWIKATELLFDLVLQDHLEVGPTIGGTYVLTADQKNVLRASWGIHHDIPNAGYFGANYLGAATGSNTPTRHELYDLNLDGVFETDRVTPGSTGKASNIQIDPNRRQGYAEDWIIGYQRQLPGNLSVDVAFVRRYYKDRPARVEVNAIYENGVFKGYRNEAFNDMFLITSNKWNWVVYSGFEFVAAKRTQKMNVLASYTRAYQHMDGTWQPGDPAGILQPDAFANNRGLGTIRGNVTNSLSGGADTRNPMWEDHMLRIGGTYFAPYGLVFASNLTVQSGPYTGPVVTRIAAPDPKFGPPTVRLSNGRVVSNPLATTIRFAYEDRGKGQVKTPNLIVWNIRIGRDFKLANSRRLELAFDVFNVDNRGADQQFRSGGNQLYSPNYAIAPDGSFRGLNRQPPRVAQIIARFAF
ncbi:MAG: TonB-dependent receptor, partial [Acidobacteria bacterium]|nr:TonB-dependent receptor [Acidobacteriota bacterium]